VAESDGRLWMGSIAAPYLGCVDLAATAL
jgi:hypothetical protein